MLLYRYTHIGKRSVFLHLLNMTLCVHVGVSVEAVM